MARRLLSIIVASASVVAAAGFWPGAEGQSASASAAGTIRGRVDVRTPMTSADPRPGIAELGQDVLLHVHERREAVVYLESAPEGAFESASASRATMSQRHETFIPHVLAVRVGTVVDFLNEDGIYHNVFSLSPARRFDSSDAIRKGSRSRSASTGRELSACSARFTPT